MDVSCATVMLELGNLRIRFMVGDLELNLGVAMVVNQ